MVLGYRHPQYTPLLPENLGGKRALTEQHQFFFYVGFWLAVTPTHSRAILLRNFQGSGLCHGQTQIGRSRTGLFSDLLLPILISVAQHRMRHSRWPPKPRVAQVCLQKMLLSVAQRTLLAPLYSVYLLTLIFPLMIMTVILIQSLKSGKIVFSFFISGYEFIEQKILFS